MRNAKKSPNIHYHAMVPHVIPKSEILGLNFGHLTANVSKTVSRRVTCQLQLNISSTKAF